MKISILITAWKEERTITTAVKQVFKSAENAKLTDFEVILASPDDATLNAGKNTDSRLILLKDNNEGKPAAMDQAFRIIKGEIIILTDGDVYIDDHAIERMLPHFADPKVGIVCGHPKPQDDRSTMLRGYWPALLTEVGAHAERSYKMRENDFFEASGYLYAIRNANLKLPHDVLAEDAFISHWYFTHGYKINYEPSAFVYVKYCNNIRDWYKQKRRSAGGHNQVWEYYRTGILDSAKKPKSPRNFGREVSYFFKPFGFARTPKELWWTILLYPARLWLWVLIFWDINLGKRKKVSKGLWERIESTK